MKSPKKNGIGEVVTDYGRRVMKIFKKGLLQRSLFDFYGDIKADSVKIKESSSVPSTPTDGDGGVIYTKSADGKLYYKSNEVSEVELSSSGATLTTEQVQDIVGAMFSSNTETNITVTYQDADGTIDLVSTDTNTQLTTEEVQDIVGAMFTSNTETRISATYEDSDGTIDLVVDDMTSDTQLTTEQVQDIVGAMFSGNTETRISATYEDSDGTIDLVVDAIPVDLTSDGAGTIHANNVPTLNQSTTGNAATATALETARTIGGVSFDGTSSINLPGVNTSGNQNTSGNAATATLATNAQGITGATDGDVTITSDGEVTVKLDSDNDESNQKFKITNNADTEVASIDEAGNLQVDGDFTVSGNEIKDSGGNTIISSDGSGVVTLAGGNIGFGTSGGSQNYNLNINSGSDIILEADQNGGGGDSTIQYPDSGGTNRIMLAADNDVVILSNRASNGTVQIRANTSTAGGSGEVTVVTVEDSRVDISKDLYVTGIITGKQREIYSQSFLDDLGTTKHYLPWKDINEQTTIYQEEAAMLMPCDGRIVSVTVKVMSITGSGNMTIGVNTIAPNINAFGSANWTEEETETLAIDSADDYHVFHFAFGNVKHFDSGDLVSLSIQNDADLSSTTYWYVSTVVEYDWNTFLGTTSAEHDSNP